MVTTPNGTYGAPVSSTRAGGALQQEGIREPRPGGASELVEFVANVEKVKADGKVTPVQQTYGDTWTSQLFVLGDFANVSAQDPDWATEYTANEVRRPAGTLSREPGRDVQGWLLQ